MKKIVLGSIVALSTYTGLVYAAQVFTQDVIVQGSECVGIDCSSSESFGFDTLRLKENNLRIKFQDTSTSASFPSNDWQLTANESDNGGLNKFSIDDVTGAKTPFTIIAGAPSNSLYVDSSGRVGLGTSAPVVNAHIKEGNTPTLRLEQDGSSGFTPQTWDLAGNETNFFVRDVTNGSKLPFKIFPNAPTNALTIEASTGDIGIDTTSPEAPLHVNATGVAAGSAAAIIKSANNADAVLGLGANPNFASGNQDALIVGYNGASGGHGFIGTRPSTIGGGDINFAVENTTIMTLSSTGLDIVSGDLRVAGQALTVPDYVFKDDYKLMTIKDVAKFIDKESHLPGVPSEKEIKSGALGIASFQLKLLEKIEELTLYTISQENKLDSLQAQNEKLQTQLNELLSQK